MNHNLRFFIALACLFFPMLMGCAVGDDYKKPVVSMPDKWIGLESDSVTGSGSLKDTARWWENFGDPLLSSLIEKGLEANHDIKMASSRVRQARAARAASFSSLWPQVDVSGSYKRTGSGNSQSAGEIGASDDFGEYDSFKAGFDASWELDFFGGRRRALEASGADLDAAGEGKNDVALTVSSEIAGNYFNLRSVQEQLDVAVKNIEAHREILRIAEKKYLAGLSGRLDYVSAKAGMTSSEARIPELEAAERSLILSLGVLTGEGASLIPKLGKRSTVPPCPPRIPAGLPSDLLKRRPDIRKAEALLHASTARTGEARADYFPKISLTGSFAYSGNEADSLLNWSSRSWSFGPSISIPLFNAGRIAANVEAKKAMEDEALANYEKTVLTALKDAETALFTHSSDMRRHDFLARSAKENADAADMSMGLYSAGKIDYTRVLEARRTQYSSEEALAKSNGAVAMDLVSIYKALGGGWDASQAGAKTRADGDHGKNNQ